MAKRKGKGSNFGQRRAAEAEQRRKAEQNKTIARMAGIMIVVILAAVGASAWFSARQPAEQAASGSAGTVMEGDRPLAEIDPAARNAYYTAPPEIVIDTDKAYEAVIHTEKGEMRVRLFDDQAPVTVNNFVFLANQGFYDGTTFHRVIADFMAQAGDPTGTGTGGPGYAFQDEFDPNLRFDRPGLLAMANSGPGTNGSQFFITLGPTEWLNDRHTIFGEVIAGADVLSSIRVRDPAADPNPGDVIERIEIIIK